jgi:phosphopantothenoylcysteine decarboxylase/phosphopantothenate--cysteine ligase
MNPLTVLITSGGTKVPIDDVRFIGNMSSGRYGAEIGNEFLKFPNTFVKFLYSKESKTPRDIPHSDEHKGTYESFPFKDYFEYETKAISLAKTHPDIIISAAAVSDYIVDKTEGKISSDNDELIIRLKKANKVLPQLKQASPNSFIVGFKLLVSPKYEEVNAAVSKVFFNGADAVVYNDLAEIRKGNNTRLLFVDKINMHYRITHDTYSLVEFIKHAYSLKMEKQHRV